MLLIDEAELHLHYDAQADLVQMLAKQNLAKKVIYTTHSIGCLPEDFGSGIRLIQPMDEKSSAIVNKFWAHGGLGLSPLLLAMGAATMAFLPVRFCVLTEGITDMLLFPTLIREATGKEFLGFQMSPGLAEASGPQLSVLNNEGRRVIFLIDGDEGGKNIAKQLKKSGVQDEKIIRLDEIVGEACVAEDFVQDEVYVLSLNEELRRSGHTGQIILSDIPATLRPRKIKDWCTAKDFPEPNKVSVAYRVLDQRYDRPLVAPQHAENLRKLYDAICKSLQIDGS